MSAIDHIIRGVSKDPTERGPKSRKTGQNWAFWELENAKLLPTLRRPVIFIEEGSFAGHTCVNVYDVADPDPQDVPVRCYYVDASGCQTKPDAVVTYALPSFVNVVQAVTLHLRSQFAQDKSLGKKLVKQDA